MNTEMDFIYITNNGSVGSALEKLGVRWIMIDLESIGKNQRQANRNTVISSHSLADVELMRNCIVSSKLLVRINPMGAHSKDEINGAIDSGADAIMLPFFQNANQVEKFIQLVDKRCKLFLLLETLDAIRNLNRIVQLEGIDYIHIGLNDLHIERKTSFMFEFLIDGSIDPVITSILERDIPFGIGGIGKFGKLIPPAENILTEHIRLGSRGVILSRSFMNQEEYADKEIFIKDFENEFNKLKDHIEVIHSQDPNYFANNQSLIIEQVKKVVRSLQ